ncbi:hypothetical protein PMZ80_005182 [Knufia obscura]|uniref:BTB domain-containing protein n=1 Tax=Knufia obscura TaxID=1635080 RepID=A0ABR0RPT3_9EURO|nr:hypothetical protein PMZ80_005182 [Knufia obscura]
MQTRQKTYPPRPATTPTQPEEHHPTNMTTPFDFSSGDLTQTVTVFLRDRSKTTFTVHKELLCSESLFFQGCLSPSSNFKEARKEEVKIGDTTDVASLRALITWLYRGKASLVQGLKLDCDESHAIYQEKLTKLYILADNVMMYSLKNDILDVMSKITGTIIALEPQSVETLLEADLNNSKLGAFMVDNIAYTLHKMPGIYHGPEPWAKLLRSMLDDYPGLAKSLLDANFALVDNPSRSQTGVSITSTGMALESAPSQRRARMMAVS